MKRSIQKLLLFQRKIPGGLLHQNLELMELMNLFMESIAYARKKTRREIGSFLNHYDFAYVRKDTVNQAAKVAPGIIKGATNKISKIVQQRIDQIISQGGKEIERVLCVILRRAIEDVYQTPFRLLGDFGKKQLNKLKSQILR